MFKFKVFKFLENELNLGIFTHAPSFPTKPFPVLLITSSLKQKKFLISPSHFFVKNLFPPTAKTVGGNSMIHFIKVLQKI